MDAASVYIPMDRRQALARGEHLPDRMRGAALFADISGFTPLTDALVHAFGPRRGAEELLHRLNRVYDTLISEIHRLRGSVIGFSGDAITCWFGEDDGLRATACGLALQRAMLAFAAMPITGGSTVALAIKVAVAAGPARRFVVGDPGVQLVDVVAGVTLARMAAAEHLAEKGEVVVDQDVAASLAEAAHVVAWRVDEETGRRCAVIGALDRAVDVAPWPELAPGALSPDLAGRWLLPAVFQRLQGGQGDFLAELRPAVSLFLRFAGIDYDGDEGAGDRLNAYLGWVQRIVTRHGGNLIQVTVGDKGSYLYAAFGAPLAYGDDAARAVAAALELRATPPRDGEAAGGPLVEDVQIGISRGRMRVGACGGTACRTYAVIGNETNMAARLMARAQPGQILLSDRVTGIVEERFDVQLIGPMQMKGRVEPVIVSEVLGHRQQSSGAAERQYGSPLVGREAELARVTAIVGAAAAGEGRILRIEGPAGIGKSHFSAALVGEARRQGLRVATGASQSTTQETAYVPWRTALRALLDLGAAGDAEPGAEAARQVAVLEEWATETNPDWLLRLPLLGDLLGLPIPDNATTAAFEPRLRQSALFDLVVEIAQNLSQAQPLLLLLDDVHWLDEASQGLTVALGRAVAQTPLVLALVHRPPLADSPILSDLDGLAAHERLDLSELSPAGVAALVTGRLGGEPTPVVAGLVQAVAQGNPFFVEELVDNLRESGSLLRRDDGCWWLSDALFTTLRQSGSVVHRDGDWTLAPATSLAAADLGLPDSVHGMVLARLDRLPEEAKLTLKVASVIGATFDLAVLAQAHPLGPGKADLAAHLAVLETRDFARLETPPHVRYVFKHNVTREVAYETLLYTQRRQLHGAVGASLERLTPDAAPQLAHHFFVAEEWPRALAYQVAAGKQGQRLFANFDAVEHFTRALQSASHLDAEATAAQRQEIHVNLGELLTTTSQYDTALEHLQQSLDLATTLGDADAQARACRWFGRLYEQRGEYPSALDWIQRGLDALDGRETADAAEALITAGLIHTRRGDYVSALARCTEARHMAEQCGVKTVIARANGLQGMIAWRRGNGAHAILDLQRALDLYEEANEIQGQGRVHNLIAQAYFEWGHWAESAQHFHRAREIFHQIGDVYNRLLADNNLGTIARFQGRLDDAWAYREAALRSLEQLGGSPYEASIFEMNLADVLIARGDTAGASRHLAIGRDRAAQAHAKALYPDLHRLAAEAAMLAGELELARTEAGQSRDIARELGMTGDEGHALRVLGEVAAARGEADEAEHDLRESLAILREVGQEYGTALSELALAQFLVAHGSLAEAQQALDECMPVFARLEAALELERARALRAALAVAR